MSDWVKTGQPVPLWYKVTVTFTDGEDPAEEHWNGKDYADRAIKEWHRIAEDDRALGMTYQIESATVTPMFTPMP